MGYHLKSAVYVLSVPLCTTGFPSGHDIGFGAGRPGFASVYLSCRSITRVSICWTLGVFPELNTAGGGSNAMYVPSVPLCTTDFPSGHDNRLHLSTS